MLTFVADDKSSHWKARFMFAKANRPSEGLSCNLFDKFSLTMQREMKEELLFAMLFFGLALFAAPLPTGACKLEFPSPNAGADPTDSGPALPVKEVAPSLLPGGASPDDRPSFGCSFILEYKGFEIPLRFVSILYRGGGACRELSERREIFVPAVAGCGVVARGFGFRTGVSDGCGGGVARCKSSLST